MIISLLRKIRISFRLTFGLSILLALAIYGTAFLVSSAVNGIIVQGIDEELKNTTHSFAASMNAMADASIRNRLNGIAEKNLEIVQGLYRRQRSGELTEAEAQKRAAEVLLSQRIGHTGYLYVLDSNGQVLVHPREEVAGTDVGDHDFVRKLTKMRRGYLEYDWRNPDDIVSMKKVLSADYFAPWDWIITASAYRHEFGDLVKPEDFAPAVEAVTLGESGYVFVVDGNGHPLLHPGEAPNLLGLKDAKGKPFGSRMLTERNGSIGYWWRDRPDSQPREKFALFREVPAMDWIVVATVYTEELYKPLHRVRFIAYGIGTMTLLLIFGLAMGISRSITEPLNRFTGIVDRAGSGDYSVRIKDLGGDELARLSKHFDGFMDQLVASMTELKNETQYRKHEAFQRHLFEEVFVNALEGICITDATGTIIAINPAFTTITGYSEDEVLGKNPRMLKSNRHPKEFYEQMWASIVTNGHWVGEIWNRRKSGEVYPELLSISAIKEASGRIRHFVSVFHDMTDEKRKEEQIYRHIYLDALTGLPNKELLLDRIAMAATHARERQSRVGLMFIDLDNFKNINDSMGHPVGDNLLQLAGRRLVDEVVPGRTVARYSGDEFVLLLENVKDTQMVTYAERVLAAFREPFSIAGNEVFVTTSIGVSMFPEDAEDPATLVRNAEMAMYQAKESGKNGYNMFAEEMNERVMRRLQLEGNLRRALLKREFVVHYQPKVSLSTGRVVGAEALVRWVLSDGTLVSPAEFIPLAEETGMIVQLGEQVLETVCGDMENRSFPEGFRISVNLSTTQFAQAELVENIRNIVQQSEVSPEQLEFEITESVLMQDIDTNTVVLNQLVEQGFSVSIDDFGTGHSSLYYLKKLPIETLKIDRSFVRDIVTDPSDSLIVQTVVLMADSLHLQVVAEGVETDAQADLLRQFGCSTVQGFLYAKPMPFLEFMAYCKAVNT